MKQNETVEKSVETSLSHGQLYSWREIETYPPDWRTAANIPATWDLRGIPTDRVESALRALVDRHEPLRTTYHVADAAPTQRVHTAVTLPIDRFDRVITDYGEPDRTTAELATVPIPMTDSLCWHGVLVTMHGQPMYLSLSFSHLILDIWSTLELERQFHTLAADPDAELPPTVAPRALAHGQRMLAREGKDGPIHRYWGRIVAAEPPVRWPTLPSGGTADRIQVSLRSHHLTELLASAAAAHGVTGPAVLMSLVAAGLSRHTGSPRVLLSLMSSNRFAPALKQTVGTLNQLVPLVTETDHDGSLAEQLKRTHWAAAKAYRYSSYDVDRIFELASGPAAGPGHNRRFNELFPCWFNYLDLGGSQGEGDEAVLEWEPHTRQYGQPFDTRITVRDGQTTVALRADPAVVGPEALVDLVRLIVHGAQQALTAPDRPLTDVYARLPEQLPYSLFRDDSGSTPLPYDRTSA